MLENLNALYVTSTKVSHLHVTITNQITVNDKTFVNLSRFTPSLYTLIHKNSVQLSGPICFDKNCRIVLNIDKGECSAGTLPVAWVDEGPGPPTCPNSCKNLPLNNKHNTGINNNNNNNNENNISNNDNNNNNYNNKNLNNNKKNYNNINNNLNFHNDNKLETKPVSYANNFSIKLRNSQMSKTRETEIGAAATPVNNRHYNARKISQNFKFNPNHNNYNKNFSNNYNLNVENNSIHHRREKKDSINQVLLQKTKDKFIATATAIKEKNITVTATTTATAMTTLASHVNASSAFDATTAAAATTANTTTTTSTATNITTTIIVTTSSSSIAIKNITTNQEHSKLNAADFKQQDNVKSAVTSPIAIAVDTMPLRKYSNNNNNFKDTLKVDIKPTRYDSNDGNELIYNRLNPDYDHNNNNNERSPRNFNILSRETRDQPFKWMPDSNQLIIEDYDTNDKKQEMKEDVNEKERKRKQQKQQQQCLEYLGDSDKTTPKHLCNLNSPGELLSQLRQLRLKNCCERNVYSALHTLALNVTLSGGDECERILNHIMELDALAARITCGLSNILYRFDCRQIYSIIHQCDDCKKGERRRYLRYATLQALSVKLHIPKSCLKNGVTSA
uniref:Uncharacterized protein n=1 Tax=Glossina brevipalpis TaxID=37001 RepID=A0A1A9WK25_9MUSC